MFDRIASLFAPAAAPRPAHDGREALAAVLVRAAEADGTFDADERALIEALLARRYGLGADAARALVSAGEAAAHRAPDLVSLTRAIKDSVPHAERIAVIEAVWEVAYADGARCHTEAALVRKLCGLLYVEDRDAGLARQRVARRMGAE
ncbi:MAG: TerB family tellurite resistance protein [Thermohalobaculum sp.]|nr:TerB family tellurite resistance protein [Thermohalobaculum sp.]